MHPTARMEREENLMQTLSLYNLIFTFFFLIACKRTLKMNIAIEDEEGNTQQNSHAQSLMGYACFLASLKY